jgi:hypothetical protein
MRSFLRFLSILALGFGALGLTVPPAPAQTNSPPNSALAEREKALCRQNLETIFHALRAYQADHRDLPMWLSDLVPKYLKDANILICPACTRTGATESPPLADPKLPSSYLFEFCPVPLGEAYPAGPERTRREWKRRQMGVIGSAVPLIRCRHHRPTLNVGFDGKIYEAPIRWELVFTNLTTLESLRPAKLFSETAR